jgi:PAS domain S-box-containing protein
MRGQIRVLYVDDYPLDRELVRDALEKEHGGFEVIEAASRADFQARLAEGRYDLVLSDFNILGFEGLAVIEAVHAKEPRLPVVIVTGTGSEEIAVEALKRGAADYVIKTPKHILRLPQTIHAAIEKARLAAERDRLFNYSLDLLGVAGFDGYLKQVNPAWSRTLGWTGDELLARPYLELVHPEDRDATTEAAGTLATGAAVLSLENGILWKAGAFKWLSWNLYPLADEALIFAVGRDVTDRKRAEAALAVVARRQRRFLREMLFSITEGCLRLCDGEADLPTPLTPVGEAVDLTAPALSPLRRRIAAVGEGMRMSPERVYDVVSAASESAMNAIVHAGGGVARIHADGATRTLQIWVQDQGTGITEEAIHRATLERGWTSAGSLGHGFWIMLHTTDRIWLLTDRGGTTVVIEQAAVSPEMA